MMLDPSAQALYSMLVNALLVGIPLGLCFIASLLNK